MAQYTKQQWRAWRKTPAGQQAQRARGAERKRLSELGIRVSNLRRLALKTK